MRKPLGWRRLLFLAIVFNIGIVISAENQTIVKSRVVLKDGGTPEQRERIGATLSAVLQEINRVAAGRGNFDVVRPYCTPEGFRTLKDLVEKTACFSTFTEHNTNLLETPNGQYEVRGIKLRLNKDDTNRGEPIQYMVFALSDEIPERIAKANFAIEEAYYKRILEQGPTVQEMLNRKVVLDLLEEFRTAHNRKDIEYLKNIYSDDALIIVGQMLKKQKRGNNGEIINNSGDKNVKFIRLSKQEYIARLSRAFEKNAFVKVFFDDAELTRHPKFSDIYGVNVRQRWNSSSYYDSGYLFLMFDFRKPEQPLIRVRSWQPEPFEDGSVVRLGNFEIIRD
jgi:hypothetical protein